MKTHDEQFEQYKAVEKAMERMKPDRRAVVEDYISELTDMLNGCENLKQEALDQNFELHNSLAAQQNRISYLMQRAQLFEMLFSRALYGLLHSAKSQGDLEKAEGFSRTCEATILEFMNSEVSKNNP